MSGAVGHRGLLSVTAKTDPYISNVVALFHFAGADGSTTFTDERGHAFTVNGDAKISTAQYKFGSSSGYFDGSGDSLSIASSSDFSFGNGDFTVEAWIYPTALSATYHILFDTRNASVERGALFWVNSSGYLRAWGETSGDAYSSAGAITTGVWRHVAVSCKSGTLRVFVNGTVAANTTTRNANALNADRAFIAQTQAGGDNYAGYIADLRVTKGVARYVTSFTPPTSPFPNS